MNLNQHITQLELAIGEIPDKSDAQNLLEKVWQAKEILNDVGGWSYEADEILHAVGRQVNSILDFNK